MVSIRWNCYFVFRILTKNKSLERLDYQIELNEIRAYTAQFETSTQIDEIQSHWEVLNKRKRKKNSNKLSILCYMSVFVRDCARDTITFLSNNKLTIRFYWEHNHCDATKLMVSSVLLPIVDLPHGSNTHEMAWNNKQCLFFLIDFEEAVMNFMGRGKG